MLKPRQAVIDMAPYSPPTGAREDKIRLDFNEHTVGCSPKVIEFLRDKLSGGRLTMYPEYAEAMRELAEFFGVSPDELALTNGTDEAIQVFVNTFVERGDDVVLLKPSYAMYRFYADLAGGKVREVEYRAEKDLTFPREELLTAIKPETKAVMIANPNNPTGTGAELEDLRRVIESAPNTAVLIDEAYYEFSGKTVLGWIRRYPNLFVSRTFSKVYGMAAMRCGCIFSSAENVKWMRKAQSPYSVNMLATLAARAAVRDRAHVDEWVAEVQAAREMVCQGLKRLGISFYTSEANFVLFQAGDRAIPIRDALRKRGVLVRDRSYEIPGCVRVTIGTREQMRTFLTELETLWTR